MNREERRVGEEKIGIGDREWEREWLKKKRRWERVRDWEEREERGKKKKNYLSILATVGCIYPYLL